MTHNTDQHRAPMSGQSSYSQNEAERLVLESDRSVQRRAFQKILEYAVIAEQAYPASGHLAVIRQIAELMLRPETPQLRDLLVVTCEIERLP